MAVLADVVDQLKAGHLLVATGTDYTKRFVYEPEVDRYSRSIQHSNGSFGVTMNYLEADVDLLATDFLAFQEKYAIAPDFVAEAKTDADEQGWVLGS